MKTLWVAEIGKVTANMKHKQLRKKLKEYGYKPETIDLIIDFYTR